MVRRAVVAGALALPVAAGLGWLAGDAGGAASASLGVIVVVANFAAHGLSLAWAAGISIPAVHAVALGGFVLRMGVVVLALVLLDRVPFFSAPIFGVSAVIATMALLVYEARLVKRGVGGALDLPADPAAVAASQRLREREEALR
jgi:hypothetical protein